MKETKKIRVKVKKKKLKIRKIILFLILLILIVNFIYCLMNVRTKNIYVINNNIVSDKEIIDNAGLNDYPPYLFSFRYKLKQSLLNNPYIKEVKIKKRFLKIYLDINEYKPICIYNGKVLLENGGLLDNSYNISGLPIIINEIDLEEVSKYFSKIDYNILHKISQIEYSPNEVDKERYLLYMVDGNSVYITLNKIEKINKYNNIISQMEEKKGIIYLDSGDYIELK